MAGTVTLEALRQHTTVVADSGDIETAQKYRPQDATTNPSLILAASKLSNYQHLLENALSSCRKLAREQGVPARDLAGAALDRLIVNFGVEYLKIIPGRVSTEVDARLSHDTEGTVRKARALVALYEAAGISRSRVLIKVAGTWEGIEAVRILEGEGIHCNVTLIFSLIQAAAAAEAGATLVSPFVGRISDWYKKHPEAGGAEGPDRGVLSVKRIFAHLRAHHYRTIVMGASFRTTEQIIQLAGIDLLTISPALLEQLRSMETPVNPRAILDLPPDEEAAATGKLDLSRDNFEATLQADPMASELLRDGIERFDKDAQILEAQLAALLSQ